MTARTRTDGPMLDPVMAVLGSAMRFQFADDPAAQRAICQALDHYHDGTVYDFDGCEVRVVSYRRSHDGMWHVSDGVACTCENGRRPWCDHRALFRLLMARATMVDPGLVRATLLEQNDSADGFPRESLVDDEDPEHHGITGGANLRTRTVGGIQGDVDSFLG